MEISLLFSSGESLHCVNGDAVMILLLQLQLNGRDLHKIIHSGVGHLLCECPPLVNYSYKNLLGNLGPITVKASLCLDLDKQARAYYPF